MIESHLLTPIVSLANNHILILLLAFCATWGYLLFGKLGWVSDDVEGVAKFSDRFDKDSDKKIDFYEVEHDKKKIKIKNTGFNRYIEFPGCVIRWLRLNLGKKFQSIGKNSKGHDVYGYVQSPVRHHLISLIVHLCNCFLLYSFLTNVFGERVGFLSTLIFIVNPISCQAVAWISGIGYLLSLTGILALLNIVVLTNSLWLTLPASVIFTGLSIFGLLSGGATFIVLAFMGKWLPALVSLVVAVACAFKQGKQVVDLRRGEFKKQNMSASIYPNIRKPIVMVKTFYYYLKMTIWPKRLGLFHTWGYHYDEVLEHIDSMFWKGILSIVGLGAVYYFSPYPIHFGIVWFVGFLLLFLNFITAQQFVADRYAFIPAVGWSICLGYLLQDSLPIFGIILGIYIMRTWVHLPTFKSEVEFYQSNIFNFPNSEVAYGNLGVIYVNMGFHGMAVDTWLMATNLNPHYDVPHYNIYSILKSNHPVYGGRLHDAREFLKKCLGAKIVHFDKVWDTEAKELDRVIGLHSGIEGHLKTINAVYRR